MVLVDKLTKDIHFIPFKMTHKATKLVEIYMKEIARLNGVLEVIVSDRDSKFTLNVWKGLFKGFGTNLDFNKVYHPKLDGKIERINQIIEDILRMYVMDQPSRWEDYLHLVEFAYNNGYRASLTMIMFQALHGRKCNTLVRWNNPIVKVVIGPELLREMEEKMVRIKQNLKTRQDRQKIYANKGRAHKEFIVGEHLFSKVKAKKSSLKLGGFPKVGSKILWAI
jgi:hypothetical protein